MTKGQKKQEIYVNASSWGVFSISAIVYMLTLDRSASFWDCPEYITCASLLEVGHPPGNPIWMLAMRFATMMFPQHLHAMVVNASSALFMAFASFFLARIVFAFCIYVGTSYLKKIRRLNLIAACGSFTAATCFAFCDSTWFSAVEAEVYAMSAFLTSLSIWLMIKWSVEKSRSKQRRWLILVAYITGLSLGVHQLNLLCIPVFAIIYIFRRHPQHATWKAWGAILLSFVVVGLILLGMMPGVLWLAKCFELFAVNTLHLPYFSGAIALLVILLILFIAAFALISNPKLLTAVWMTAFILLGYSSFAIILIRGYAAPPMNEAAPTDIFALASYIARDQYGSKPLFYGPTSYSKPMLQEEWREGDSLPRYTRYALQRNDVEYAPIMGNARLHQRSGMMSAQDYAANDDVIRSKGSGYLISDYSFTRITTPELNMFFPRITGTSPYDIESYEDWTGMNKENMTKVRISEAFDTLGNTVGKMLADGSREEKYSWRPTYLQNLQMFLSYQVYYMYFRYLLWNFVGRQNDIHSTGEIEHGNFITGLPLADNAMLGDQSLLPDYAGKDNPGRHIYFGLPFLLAILGIGYLATKYNKGKRIQAIVTLMFLMTGLAIVVYLNQTPGEARERDYSFLGSYMAFCIWIGFGIMYLLTLLSKTKMSGKLFAALSALISLAAPAIMVAQNYGDHQRAGRSEPLDFASDILNADRPSIIFSHGDNSTFPLWYAQETEGIGQQHTVIDISYLMSPGYVINLMKQGSKGLHLTATPADIAYNAYAFTRIAPDADTVPVPLIKALKDLYAQRDVAPTMRYVNVMIPGNSLSDTLKVNLRSLASGGSLTFRTLMLLDIIATNNATSSPKALRFLYPVKGEIYKAVKDALKEDYGSHVYDPFTPDSLHALNLNANLGNVIDRLNSSHDSPYYRDPIIINLTRRQRGNIVIAAKELLHQGKINTAAEAAEAIAKHYPYDEIQAGSFTVADTTYHEGIEYGKLLTALHTATGNDKYSNMATDHNRLIRQQAEAWQRYYRSLSPRQRSTVSTSTLRIISSLKAPKPLPAGEGAQQ